jgi:TonB-dependent SusC/RagA subfamily outer membrane receptor
MNTIAPDQIQSINVIKGPAASAKYNDPRAANGVIEITTKKPKP